MQTFITKRPIIENPNFSIQRNFAHDNLNLDDIDTPIVDLIKDMAMLPYCFTQQCCYGHFVYDKQSNTHNLEPLKQIDGALDVEYRIAYIAICVDNSGEGLKLLAELEDVVNIDNANIQFGSATWFWNQQVNSYVLQVQPDRLKDKDKMIIDIQEAYHIESIKKLFFDQLKLLVKNRLSK